MIAFNTVYILADLRLYRIGFVFQTYNLIDPSALAQLVLSHDWKQDAQLLAALNIPIGLVDRRMTG